MQIIALTAEQRWMVKRMSKSPNLYDCTAEELADWILQAKREGIAIMFPNGFLFSSQAQVLAEAYRIVGYKEGYKRGKRNRLRLAGKLSHPKVICANALNILDGLRI